MDRWVIIGVVIAAWFGTLTFLRILGHELVVKNRQIELQVEKEREAIKRRAEEAEQERLQQVIDESNSNKGSL